MGSSSRLTFAQWFWDFNIPFLNLEDATEPFKLNLVYVIINIFICFIRLRHGSELNADLLVDILPRIITDFLSPMEVLQTVVTDFISPHQNKPKISGTILYEVLNALMNIIGANHNCTLISSCLLFSLQTEFRYSSD